MKFSLILFLVFSLSLQSTAFSQQVKGKKIQREEITRTGLITGVQRMELLSDSATLLENPGIIKPVGDPVNLQSVDMYALTEMLGASDLTANEIEAKALSQSIVLKCNDDAAIEEAKVNGTLQLYSQSCIIYELINSITGLITENDSLEKQNIEAQAAKNQAAGENAKRDAEIDKEKKKMQEVNKQIKKAISDLKKAKEAQEKAQKAVDDAQKALDAANAIQCGEDDDGSCSSAKAAAIEAATKALEAAKKELEKANRALERAVSKMVNLLADKLGVETSAVLALISGTISADTEGGNVNFQVGDSDFTLANVGDIIADTTGSTEDRAREFIGSDDNEPGTDSYFENLIKNYDESIDEDGNSNSNGGGLGVYGPQGDDIRDILEVFLSHEGGLENLETIALAVGEYAEQRGEKQIKAAEAMKTPQSRQDEIQRKIEERNAMIANNKKMLAQSMDFLEKSLKVFKELFKLTQTELSEAYKKTVEVSTVYPRPNASTNSNQGGQTVVGSTLPVNPFYAFINRFATDKLKKKIEEGYKSEVDYLGIQAAFKCYADAGTENACKALADKVLGN